MSTVLPEHATQVRFWGYSILGDAANELALLAEQGGPFTSSHAWWDSTAASLARVVIVDETGPHPPPEHWALHAVTELRIRWDEQFWEVVAGGTP